MGDENCGRGTLCDDLRGRGANVRSRMLMARAGAFSGTGVPARLRFLEISQPALGLLREAQPALGLLRCGCGGTVGKYDVCAPHKNCFLMG